MERDDAQADWSSLVLLERFRDGDDRAAEDLFARYFRRLTALARRRLSARLARRTDPEDVVQSVYRSFFVEARAGRFTLRRGGDLWRLLASITRHKLAGQARHHTAERRSIDVETPLGPAGEEGLFARAPGPSVEEAVAWADELEWIFSQLNPLERRVLELRLQGAQHAEIAAETGRSERTIRRTLAQIRVLLAGRLVVVPPSGFPLLAHGDVSLRRMIGAGRMGKVYEGWQHAEGRAVAVKYLRKSCLREPSVVHRFLGEARTIAGLDHPHIVGLHGLGHAPGGAYFLVMELVDGPNLALVGATRKIAVAEALRWTIQTCEALEHAHARGVIHCDLKPANLLLDGSGAIRVTDFGLARSLNGEAPWAAEVEGTAPFMAPEQASRTWGPISERTDIYGIGAVLYALLTGRPPWPGWRLLDILDDVRGPVPVIPARHVRTDISDALDALCGRCLSKAPADRYATVKELRTALEEASSSPHQGTVHR